MKQLLCTWINRYASPQCSRIYINLSIPTTVFNHAEINSSTYFFMWKAYPKNFFASAEFISALEIYLTTLRVLSKSANYMERLKLWNSARYLLFSLGRRFNLIHFCQFFYIIDFPLALLYLFSIGNDKKKCRYIDYENDNHQSPSLTNRVTNDTWELCELQKRHAYYLFFAIVWSND